MRRALMGRTRGAGVWLAGAVCGFVLVISCDAPARAQKQAVAIELVLAVDVSLSVNAEEFALQRSGLAQALRQRRIVNAIRQQAGGVAIAVMQWSGWRDYGLSVGWRHLSDAGSVHAFADDVEAMERVPHGVLTGIGYAIRRAMREIEMNAYQGAWRKIDVSGDGRSNTGPDPADVRRTAFARGITINGLALLTDDADLDGYYEDDVIVGPGAFAMAVDDYDDYAEAMARKLFRELSPVIAEGPNSGQRTADERSVAALRCDRGQSAMSVLTQDWKARAAYSFSPRMPW